MAETTGAAPDTSTSTGPAKRAPAPVAHDSHGNSVAAWTGVGIVLLGTAISCAGVMLATVWVFVVGLVVVVAGAVVGKILSAMGFGSTVHEDAPTSPRQGTS